jgi:hypothetical protein
MIATHSIEAFILDRSDEPFRVRVQIGRSRWQAQRLDASIGQQGSTADPIGEGGHEDLPRLNDGGHPSILPTQHDSEQLSAGWQTG